MVGLAKSGASVGASLAYWFGNTMLNPATIVFMGFVLGWNWAGLRIVVGVLLVFGVAHLGNRYLQAKDVPQEALEIADAPEDDRPLLVRWASACWKLLIGLVPEYAVIVLALGAARAWLFPAMNPAIGHSLGLMLALAVAGTLFVIPTAGEVPIVQSLLGFGLGAGAAGALLTTLPPVSLPSLVMVGRALPLKVMVFAAVSVVILGVLSGFAAMALI